MAEIRSTMDLVMERAARMGKASSEELNAEQVTKKGMQIAAEYLNGRTESGEQPTPLQDTLASFPEAEQQAARKGILETLLRNIFLARDDLAKERIAHALEGIVLLGGGAPDVQPLCQELQTITGQYATHREQYREQLKQQMQMQIEQLLAQKGMSSEGMNIDPTSEPQFQEEWGRIEAELNGQYEQALTQYRDQLKQRLGIA